MFDGVTYKKKNVIKPEDFLSKNLKNLKLKNDRET